MLLQTQGTCMVAHQIPAEDCLLMVPLTLVVEQTVIAPPRELQLITQTLELLEQIPPMRELQLMRIQRESAWVTGSNGACYFADARILHEGYEAAAAKVLEEAARADAGVATCSDVLPLLPAQAQVVAAPAAGGGTSRPPAALSAARVLTPQTKTVVLEGAEAQPRAVLRSVSAVRL